MLWWFNRFLEIGTGLKSSVEKEKTSYFVLDNLVFIHCDYQKYISYPGIILRGFLLIDIKKEVIEGK